MATPPAAEHGSPAAQFRRYLSAQGLKASRQRDAIAEVFFAAQGHLKVDELLAEVHKHNPLVSQATVYRTLRLLVDCGLAEPRHFLDQQTRYEQGSGQHNHHDHLICTGCSAIVEFVDERIEKLQEEVAKKHGFEVTQHKMELYGRCATCRGQLSATRSPTR